MSKTKHQGKVIDSIDGRVIAITKWKKTYEEAYRKARVMAKRYKHRYDIVVIASEE